jgi:hypothetical protein
MDTLMLVNPVARPDLSPVTLAPRLPTLAGARVGFIDTGKPRVGIFLDELEVLLRAQFPDLRTTTVRKDFTSAKPVAHELDGRVDAVINAWGD